MIDIHRAEQIKNGWMSPRELRWLATHAQRCTCIIEVGSYCGRSTRAIGDHTAGIVYAVDPWERDYLREDGSVASKINPEAAWPQFQANLRDLLDAGTVVPIKMSSLCAAESVLAGVTADLIFLDGDHRYETVRTELKLYRPLLRTGGIFCGHDYGHKDWPGVQRAVDENFKHVNHEESIWWTICES